ncbi:serine hydrolase domain-containing protein [Sporosarcina sp. FSL K6-1508]|uniref:serine hydrolase domain-containing protein n=1 Tax=Sporosarcina sp. FSL K6-1508 TaxID=2921553 RepID=UPI0030F70834
MFSGQQLYGKFNPVVAHVKKTFEMVNGSGGAVVIIHKDQLVAEDYWGKHSKAINARRIQEDSQFHVASVRKSYIGFAVAYAVHNGFIASIDDPITKYLPSLDANFLNGTTIRHLLTHTHGLKIGRDEIIREFIPGQSWAYRGIGIDMLTQIVKNSTGKTIAEIVSELVFQPMKFNQTGWYGEMNEKLVEVIREPNDPNWFIYKSTEGDKMNMYVSARELALWGYFHLKKGMINKKQIIPKEIIQLATSVQSPPFKDTDNPQNGFLWFAKGSSAKRSEIGKLVPYGSYQILGYTGVGLLVIPQHDIVAVRMMNSFGSPKGFDYLADIRAFGDTVMKNYRDTF